MKEFWIYTLLRLGLFAATFVVIAGVWLLFTDHVSVLAPLILAALVSAIGSVTLLKGPRERFARKVEERAGRISARFEELRSAEDEADEQP